jgi:hypothetical protein
MQTLTDRLQHKLWIQCAVRARRAHQDRVAMLRIARANICGCDRCGDADRGHELDVLIQLSIERVAELSDQITDRNAR